jgi:hypothetical protein
MPATMAVRIAAVAMPTTSSASGRTIPRDIRPLNDAETRSRIR